MSPVREDLTAATLIRIAAMDLFAEQGYGDVIVRQIAAAAGVSPALGDPSLRFEGQFAAVLDERVAAFAGKRSPIWPGHPNSAAARASPSCAPTGSNLSRRWRATCEAAFLLRNDLAMLLLRRKGQPRRHRPMTTAVETVGLTKQYGTVTAVSDLSLRVEAGQVFGFLGPNGAGKSTTIRMLLALQRPTRGRARLLGLDAAADSVQVHRRVGYLPGDLQLFPRLTGRQHIAWFLRARGVTDSSFAAQLADRFQVVADRPVRELSKGNRQKIGLVLAFMHRPELLVLDEPTSGLDPLMQHEFETLLRETAEEGRTVFLSSHELDEVQRVTDRIAIIKDGSLVAEDTVDRLRRAAPRKMDVRFRRPVDPADLRALTGVTVTACDGPRMTIDVTGEIGPVLTVIANHDPVDLVCRPADLDELFLSFYREPAEKKVSHAR